MGVSVAVAVVVMVGLIVDVTVGVGRGGVAVLAGRRFIPVTLEKARLITPKRHDKTNMSAKAIMDGAVRLE